jgi:hypothetical protein
MGKIKKTFTQCTTHRWSNRMSTKAEMVTEVEAMEAIKAEDEKDEEILVDDEVVDSITTSIVGNLTTLVQISQSKTKMTSNYITLVEWETTPSKILQLCYKK